MFFFQEHVSWTAVLQKNTQFIQLDMKIKPQLQAPPLTFQNFISTKKWRFPRGSILHGCGYHHFCLPNPQLRHLGPDHAIGLPGARLSIGDHRTIVATTHRIHNRRHRGIVELGEWRWRWRKVRSWDDFVFVDSIFGSLLQMTVPSSSRRNFGSSLSSPWEDDVIDNILV